jgi:hypothetical protein
MPSKGNRTGQSGGSANQFTAPQKWDFEGLVLTIGFTLITAPMLWLYRVLVGKSDILTSISVVDLTSCSLGLCLACAVDNRRQTKTLSWLAIFVAMFSLVIMCAASTDSLSPTAKELRCAVASASRVSAAVANKGCVRSGTLQQSNDLMSSLMQDVARDREKPPVVILSLGGLICVTAIAMAVMIRRPI